MVIICIGFALAALLAILALVPLAPNRDRAPLIRLILAFFTICAAVTLFVLGVRG